MNNLTELLEDYETSDILKVLRERHRNANPKDEEDYRLFVIINMALIAVERYGTAKGNKELRRTSFDRWLGNTKEILDNLTIRKN